MWLWCGCSDSGGLVDSTCGTVKPRRHGRDGVNVTMVERVEKVGKYF